MFMHECTVQYRYRQCKKISNRHDNSGILILCYSTPNFPRSYSLPLSYGAKMKKKKKKTEKKNIAFHYHVVLRIYALFAYTKYHLCQKSYILYQSAKLYCYPAKLTLFILI